MNDESTLAQVVKELQSSNLSQDLILDTIDNYDFTLASNAARENTTEVPTFLDRLVNVATDLKDKFDILIRSNVVLAKRLEGNKLQERENRDELLDALRGLRPDRTRTPVKDSKFKMPGGIFSGILSAAALLAGFAVGFVGKLTSALFNVLGKTKLFQKISSVFSAISQFFTNIVTRLKASPLFKGVFTGIEKIAELINKFKSSKLFTLLGKVFSIFGNSPIIKTVSSVVGVAGEAFSVIGETFSSMSRFFKIGMKAGGGLAKMLLSVGKIVGPFLKVLGWPLTIIMGIYGGIKGAIAGFKEGGLIGGLKGLLVGVFDGLIGSLLDSVKDGISWISEKLGFSEFSKFLDSFSFTDLYKTYLVDPMFEMYATIGKFIGDLPGIVIDFFASLPEKLGALFSSAGESITGAADSLASSIDDMQRSALRAILPDPNEDLSMANPKYWFRKSVPDSIYEYAYNTKKSEKSESSEKSVTPTAEKLTTESSEKSVTPTAEKSVTPTAEKLTTESSEKILKAVSTNNFSELSKPEKAMAAGYGSWDEYAASNFKWKNNVQGVPASSGSMLATAGNISNIAPTVIVNNNNGGNVSNINTSNVNNNASPMMPILTGSAMGY
jgi:hypothetical protein